MVTEPQPDVRLEPIVLAALRDELGTVSDEVVAVVVAEVPSYRDAFAGPMGRTIRDAVALALDGFLELGARGGGSDAGTPLGSVVEGAYRLGRGEARAGRSMEALLAAYRTGARRAWRLLSDRAVAALPKMAYEDSEGALYMACRVAQRAVEPQLKAPSTAKWQSCSEARGWPEGTKMTVETKVDSQNGFGAMIRTTVRLKLEGKGKHWEPIPNTLVTGR